MEHYVIDSSFLMTGLLCYLALISKDYYFPPQKSFIMKPDSDIFWIVLTVSAVTVGLRAAPFILMAYVSDNRYLKYIGEKMPVGVMTLLVVYTFIHVDFTVKPYGLLQAVSALLVSLLYGHGKNALLSIGIGLGVHLLLLNWIF